MAHGLAGGDGGAAPGVRACGGNVAFRPPAVVGGQQQVLCRGGIGDAEEQSQVAAAQGRPLVMWAAGAAQRVVGIVLAALVNDACHEVEGEGRVNAVAAAVTEADEPAP